MNNNKTIIAVVIAGLVLIAGITTTVIVLNLPRTESEPQTSETTTNETKEEESEFADGVTAKGPIIAENISVETIEVSMVGETPNFLVFFLNTANEESKEIDCSKFKLIFSDGTSIQPTTDTKTINGFSSYTQWAFPFTKESLKAGDKVTVYYGDTNVGDLEVKSS